MASLSNLPDAGKSHNDDSPLDYLLTGWRLPLVCLALFALFLLILTMAIPAAPADAAKRPGRATPACISVTTPEALMEGVYRATVAGQSAIVRARTQDAPPLKAGCWKAAPFRRWFTVEPAGAV